MQNANQKRKIPRYLDISMFLRMQQSIANQLNQNDKWKRVIVSDKKKSDRDKEHKKYEKSLLFYVLRVKQKISV